MLPAGMSGASSRGTDQRGRRASPRALGEILARSRVPCSSCTLRFTRVILPTRRSGGRLPMVCV
eukprot:5170882-Prymnesium_polylepis.2